MNQKSEKVEITRLKVGIIAIICLTLALIVFLVSGKTNLWMPGLLRVGVLCSAVCLALPGKNQKAAWANVSPTIAWGLLIGLIILTRVRLKFFIILIPLGIAALILGTLFKPKEKQRPQNRQE
jgi:hypothetical protein